MAIRDIIIQKIKEESITPDTVSEKSNLYTDLGFDSLSFVVLLMEIEKIFSINISIAEMQDCIKVDRLITIVKLKLEGDEKDND